MQTDLQSMACVANAEQHETFRARELNDWGQLVAVLRGCSDLLAPSTCWATHIRIRFSTCGSKASVFSRSSSVKASASTRLHTQRFCTKLLARTANLSFQKVPDEASKQWQQWHSSGSFLLTTVRPRSATRASYWAITGPGSAPLVRPRSESRT